MRRLLILFMLLSLSACNLVEPALTFPTASPGVTLPTLLASQPTPTQTIVAATATASSQPDGDPFSTNMLQLPAPACAQPTHQQTEGPYYKSGSPERRVLIDSNTQGEKLLVAGYVLDQNCQPVPGALLDFWQADASGAYDNAGFNFRGHQFTDEQGRYFLETVVPGLYTGRTEHIHVKIQLPAGQVLTTQLYFPDVPENNNDDIFDPALLVNLEPREGLYVAYFNFVIRP